MAYPSQPLTRGGILLAELLDELDKELRTEERDELVMLATLADDATDERTLDDAPTTP